MEPEWTSLLVCPFCKGKLSFQITKKESEFWCLYDGIAFPCKGTTPLFLNTFARTLSVDEKLTASKKRKVRQRD